MKNMKRSVNSLKSSITNPSIRTNTQCKPFNFKKAMPSDKAEAKWLTNMHKAVKQMKCLSYVESAPLNMEFFRKEQSKALMDHPLVKECGHTGGTLLWSVNELKYIYRNGWQTWLKNSEKKYRLPL